jgi:hypothetical protein
MGLRALLAIAVGVLALLGCGFGEAPTQLAVPEGAIEPKQVKFAWGRAHQTIFTLRAQYPNDSALAHYAKALPEPWIRCDWVPEWDSFLDGTVEPVRTVHQQMHIWVNREASRSLLLSMRYYSPSDCAPKPLNDEQEVIVLEHMGVDVEEEIRTFNLKCPGRPVRSNSTLHSDAGEAPRVASSCGARAGERGR